MRGLNLNEKIVSFCLKRFRLNRRPNVYSYYHTKLDSANCDVLVEVKVSKKSRRRIGGCEEKAISDSLQTKRVMWQPRKRC